MVEKTSWYERNKEKKKAYAREYARKKREENDERFREQRRANKKCRRKRKLAKYKAYKKTLKCTICGNCVSAVLQFHHHNDNKKSNVADLISSDASWNHMKREIDKCIVLCANCHCVEHANQS